MATSASCLYEVLHSRGEIIILNQSVDDKNVGKVLLISLEDSGVLTASVHDHDDEHIKSILFDRGSHYDRYQIQFTGINRSADTIRVYDMHGKLLDKEVVPRWFVVLANCILWYETPPAIIGKRKRNGGLSKDEDEEEGEICSICYDKYQTDQMIGTMNCGHSYHEGCIKSWFSRKNQCPICRHVSMFLFLSRTCSDADKEPHVQYTNSEAKHKSETKASKAKRIRVE